MNTRILSTLIVVLFVSLLTISTAFSYERRRVISAPLKPNPNGGIDINGDGIAEPEYIPLEGSGPNGTHTFQCLFDSPSLTTFYIYGGVTGRTIDNPIQVGYFWSNGISIGYVARRVRVESTGTTDTANIIGGPHYEIHLIFGGKTHVVHNELLLTGDEKFLIVEDNLEVSVTAIDSIGPPKVAINGNTEDTTKVLSTFASSRDVNIQVKPGRSGETNEVAPLNQVYINGVKHDFNPESDTNYTKTVSIVRYGPGYRGRITVSAIDNRGEAAQVTYTIIANPDTSTGGGGDRDDDGYSDDDDNDDGSGGNGTTPPPDGGGSGEQPETGVPDPGTSPPPFVPIGCPVDGFYNRTSVSMLTIGSNSVHVDMKYSSDDLFVGPLGKGRQLWYCAQLIETTDGIDDFVSVMLPCGARLEYKRMQDNEFEPTEYTQTILEVSGLPEYSYILVFADGRKFFFDHSGFNSCIKDINGNASTLIYGPKGKISSIHDDFGNVAAFSYIAGQIVGVTDSTGRNITLSYVLGKLGNPLLSSFVRGGYSTSYGYGDDERLTSTYNNKGEVIDSTTYDTWGHITSRTIDGLEIQNRINWAENKLTEIDALGRKTITWFDGDKQPLITSDPVGAMREYEYSDTCKRVTKIKDPLGNVTSFSYDSMGRLTCTTRSDGSETSTVWTSKNGRHLPVAYFNPLSEGRYYSYNEHGNLVSVTDTKGSSTTFSYDEHGRVTSFTNKLGNITRHEYYADSDLLYKTIDPRGYSNEYEYDTHGAVSSITNKNGFRTNYINDAFRRITHVDLPADQGGKSATKDYTYNERGQITSIVDEIGKTLERSYDSYGNITEEKNPNGLVNRWVYDLAGNCVQKYLYNANTTKLVQSQSYIYDPNDRLVAHFNDKGHLSIERDLGGNVLSEQLSDGRRVDYTYDEMGRISFEQHSDGTYFSHTYDSLGRPVEILTNQGFEKYEYEFSELINQKPQVTNPHSPGGFISRITSTFKSSTTSHQYKYDNYGNLLKHILPDGSSYGFEYDENNNLVKKTDPAGYERIFTYDGAGNITSIVSPSKLVWNYEYDQCGRLKSKSTPLNNTTRYAYDISGNLANVLYPSGDFIECYYDAGDRLNRKLTSDKMELETVYNAIGKPIKLYSNGHLSIENCYDNSQRLSSVTYHKLLRKIDYTYDVSGRCSSVNLTDLNSNSSYSTSYCWSPQGRLLEIQDSCGNSFKNTFNEAGFLTVSECNSGLKKSLSYGDLGQIIEIDYTDRHSNSVSNFQYTYNDKGFISCVNDRNGSTCIEYDLRDQISHVVYPSGEVVTYDYNNEGLRSRRSSSISGLTTYTYDEDLRQVKAGSITKSWNNNGQLVLETDNNTGESVMYDWNSLGQLASVAATGYETTSLHYYQDTGLLMEEAVENQPVRKYIYNGLKPFETIENNASTYSMCDVSNDSVLVHTFNNNSFINISDIQGTQRGVTDLTNTLVSISDYRVFGTLVTTDSIFGSIGYHGKQKVLQGKLYNFWNRYYDPKAGIFLSKDPLNEEANPANYSFVRNNPVNRIDPTGLFSKPIRTSFEFHKVPEFSAIGRGIAVWRQWSVKTDYPSPTSPGNISRMPVYASIEDTVEERQLYQTQAYPVAVQKIQEIWPGEHFRWVSPIFSSSLQRFQYVCHGYAYGESSISPGGYFNLHVNDVNKFAIADNYKLINNTVNKVSPPKGVRLTFKDGEHSMIAAGRCRFNHKWFATGPLMEGDTWIRIGTLFDDTIDNMISDLNYYQKR